MPYCTSCISYGHRIEIACANCGAHLGHVFEGEGFIEKLIGELSKRGYQVATRVTPAGAFYEAEGYHQDYYDRKGGTPYCHTRVRRFDH